MELQHEKCAYCERQLASVRYGKKEHDVEHYRPKNAVEEWPTSKEIARRGKYRFATGSSTDKGYYLLAFNFRNYAAVCSSCNSALKASYFPVAGQRIVDTDNFAKLRSEDAFLLFPIGDLDDHRPEELITFEGILPVPVFRRGPRHKRARVTIDFFDLDTREDLIKQRARIIIALWTAYRAMANANSTPEEIDDAQFVIKVAVSPGSPHTSCARAFSEVCRTDPVRARSYKDDAKSYLANKLPAD